MSSIKPKRDFRKGNDSKKRTEEAKQIILRVLSREEVTFKVFMEKTGLSKPALAANLKRLHKQQCIERQIDSKDHRQRNYSITDEGRNLLVKLNYLKSWEPIDSISIDEGMSMLKESIATMLSLVTSRVIDNLSNRLVIDKDKKTPINLIPAIFQNHGRIIIKDKKTPGSLSHKRFRLGQRDDDMDLPSLSEWGRQILVACLEDSVEHCTIDNRPIDL